MPIQTDFLVIGSGAAGLSFALKASKYGTVAIITKKGITESNTNYAQGGIASVMSPDDTFDSHIQDTLTAGAGLCKKDVVEILVKEGPDRVKELIQLGAEFTKRLTPDGIEELSLGKEGGHSQRRIVHSADFTGREVERVLSTAVKNEKNISIYENHIAIDIITEHHLKSIGRIKKKEEITCWGVYALNTATGEIITFLSKVTVLATGGCGEVYLHTTNPEIATGDGFAMAYRAGAYIANMEFVQFHPTTLYHPEARSFLISEAVRGEGAVLKTKDGNTFMEKYHHLGCLAPRDIVARAIDAEMKKRGDNYVLLDLSPLGARKIREHFPQIYQTCLSFGIDLTVRPAPVVPSAHYMCGGIITDIYGKTNINKLYACGEVSCTGVHGANRLASNSLLEALVFAHRAVSKCKDEITDPKFSFPDIPNWDDTGVVRSEENILISHDKEEIQRLMSDYVGIVRSNRRLNRAKIRIGFIKEDIEKFYKETKLIPELIELRNMAMVAEMIIDCALKRKESRGLHYNVDYPKSDEKLAQEDTIIRNENI